MTLRKIIKRTLFFEVSGMVIIMASCINELFNGTGMTHPMWNASYNWLPLLGTILLISFGGSIASILSTYRFSSPTYRIGRMVKRGKYQPNYKPSMST